MPSCPRCLCADHVRSTDVHDTCHDLRDALSTVSVTQIFIRAINAGDRILDAAAAYTCHGFADDLLDYNAFYHDRGHFRRFTDNIYDLGYAGSKTRYCFFRREKEGPVYVCHSKH